MIVGEVTSKYRLISLKPLSKPESSSVVPVSVDEPKFENGKLHPKGEGLGTTTIAGEGPGVTMVMFPLSSPPPLVEESIEKSFVDTSSVPDDRSKSNVNGWI